MKHFQSKVLTVAILAALSGSAMAVNVYETSEVDTKIKEAKTEVTKDLEGKITAAKTELETKLTKVEAAATKVTDIKKAVRNVAIAAYKNNQDINGFKAKDTIYDIDENGNITKKEATEADVEADDFGGLGLKEVVAKHDESLNDLTDTVNENSEALEKTAEVVNDISTDVKANKAAIDENKTAIDKKADKEALAAVSDKADKAVEAANTAKTKAEEAINVANETKQNVDAKVEAAKNAVSEAKAEAGKAKADADRADAAVVKAEAAAAKVTDIEEAAEVALVAAHKNTQDIHGFKEGDIIYKSKDGKITPEKATKADVEADDFGGLGLKEVVAEHAQKFDTVGEALEKTAEVIDQHTKNLEAVKTAINENKDAIATKADQTALDEVSDKVDKHEAALDTKADKEALAAVSDKVGKKADQTALDAVSGKVDKKADQAALDAVSDKVGKKADQTALAAVSSKVDKNTADIAKVANHGDRLASAEKTITEHGTRLNGLDKTVSDLRKETRQGLAEQAALSGLFQPYNVGRFNVTAAVGGYKSESAVAIGTGFRFTENFAAKAGVAVGTSSGSSAAYHVGVNYEW